MTIDDNIDFLKDAKAFYEDVANNPKINETIKTYFIIESLETAIDTMRKYQKIQTIYERFQKDGGYYHHMAWLDVMEVIENGNDN